MVISERMGLDTFPQERFTHGLLLWFCSEGVTFIPFTPDLGSLTGSLDDPNLATRLFAATSVLARLPPADVGFGQASCGDRRRGRICHLHQLFVVCHRSSSGLEFSDFCMESVAMSLGLTGLTALKDSHSYSSIRIFTNYQTLITSFLSTMLKCSE